MSIERNRGIVINSWLEQKSLSLSLSPCVARATRKFSIFRRFARRFAIFVNPAWLMNKEICEGEYARERASIKISGYPKAEAKIDGAAGNGGATVSSVSVIGGAAKKIEGEGRRRNEIDARYRRRVFERRDNGGRGREVCSVWERRERDGTRRRENNARTRRCRNAGRILLWRWENFLRIIIEMAGKFCWEIIKN